MVNAPQLLADLQRLLSGLEGDVRRRCEQNPDIGARIRSEYDRAKAASRTAQAYEVWRDDYITQAAVAWILGCVFVRFLEDNDLIETAWLAGPGERLSPPSAVECRVPVRGLGGATASLFCRSGTPDSRG